MFGGFFGVLVLSFGKFCSFLGGAFVCAVVLCICVVQVCVGWKSLCT